MRQPSRISGADPVPCSVAAPSPWRPLTRRWRLTPNRWAWPAAPSPRRHVATPGSQLRRHRGHAAHLSRPSSAVRVIDRAPARGSQWPTAVGPPMTRWPTNSEPSVCACAPPSERNRATNQSKFESTGTAVSQGAVRVPPQQDHLPWSPSGAHTTVATAGRWITPPRPRPPLPAAWWDLPGWRTTAVRGRAAIGIGRRNAIGNAPEEPKSTAKNSRDPGVGYNKTPAHYLNRIKTSAICTRLIRSCLLQNFLFWACSLWVPHSRRGWTNVLGSPNEFQLRSDRLTPKHHTWAQAIIFERGFLAWSSSAHLDFLHTHRKTQF